MTFPDDQTVPDVLEHVSDAVFALDEDWRVVYLNTRAESLLDRERDALLGQSIRDAFPDVTASGLESALERAMTHGEETTYDGACDPLDAWVEMRIRPTADGVAVYARDVTDARHWERERVGYERILDSMGDGVWLVDETGRLAFVNQQVAAELGADPASFVGERYDSRTTQLFPEPEQAARYERLVAEVLAEERESGELEFEITTGGPSLVLDVHVTAADLEAGRGAVVVARDVTARKERERELRSLRRQYETIFENTQDALFLVDVDDEGQFRYARFNAVEEELVGLTTDDVREKTPREVLGTDVGERVEERYRECLERRETITYEEELSLPNGTRIWQTKLTPVVVDGEISKLVGAGRDITDLREYERQLERQRDQLQLLNRIVRHDIRNDMTVVLGFADLLASEVGDEQRPDVERILETTRHTVELTKTARDLVEMIRGETEAGLEPVDLTDAVTDEFENARRSYPDATFSMGSIPSVDVWANDLLAAVFRNLLHNAVQHNDKPDPQVDVTADEREDTVVVRVADNGPGVPDARKSEIFGKGERGLDSPGTGMGLYFVDSLVDQFGGDVRVEDNEPAGAVFEVELQKATDDAPQ